MRHIERHRSDRAGWLRASVLGANDGIVSTSSLIIGVAASGATSASIAVAGFAALVAGAMSMAAGEYVSVSSQADTERSDLTREADELKSQPAHELAELTNIYVRRGLEPTLAAQVAAQLTAHDALAAHARDELGISDALSAKPLQAAVASAGAFAIGAALPLAALAVIPTAQRILMLSGATLVCLALLGYAAAKTGGSSVKKSVLRVTFWGAIAMAATALIGKLVGVSV